MKNAKEYHKIVNKRGSRIGPTFCEACSGSRLFANLIRATGVERVSVLRKANSAIIIHIRKLNFRRLFFLFF